ncbi:MAG TPA: beta/gamma crystallin-related protein [Burkholderiaceae bacterium]|nr:beta/gamma crystallin-related protein [Burkholderiaceae bacterium]
MNSSPTALRPPRGSRWPRRAWLWSLAGVVVTQNASPQVTLYEREAYDGRSYVTHKRMGNLERAGFNERAVSLVVGSQRWEVCEAFRYRGRCAVITEGRYPSPRSMGLQQGAFSIRIVGDAEAAAASADMPAQPLLSNAEKGTQ